jgi:hypothetical protein
MLLQKIVSGGQTGVDRGALDAALAFNFACGGWCPADRSDEDGRIPASYPLTPLTGGGYRERTRQNVMDSDGTLIVFDGSLTGGTLTGGTKLTEKLATQHRKPVLVIDASKSSAPAAASTVLPWLHQHEIRVLNVAGPRRSGWSDGHDYARRVIGILLAHSRSPAGL